MARTGGASIWSELDIALCSRPAASLEDTARHTMRASTHGRLAKPNLASGARQPGQTSLERNVHERYRSSDQLPNPGRGNLGRAAEPRAVADQMAAGDPPLRDPLLLVDRAARDDR